MRIAIQFVLLIPLVLTLLPLAPAYGACTPFALNTVNPGSGVGGDPVTLGGTGFCGGTENYFAWGWDGVRGFAFDLDGGTPDTTLTGSLLPTPVAVSGPVRLWRVQEVVLPDTALQLPNGVYWLREVRLYLFKKEAVGPAFSALPSSGAGYTSQLVNGNLQIDFGTSLSGGTGLQALPQGNLSNPDPGDGSSITVWVVAETNDEEPKGQEPNPQNGPGPIRWMLHFEAVCFGAPPACDDSLVTVAGAGLSQQLSPLGMQVNVAGPILTVGHKDYELESGMVSVIPAF